jgi:hypothetical protein
MDRRGLRRRVVAVLVGVGVSSLAMAAAVGGSASGNIITKVPSQVGPIPPPGSGVEVIVESGSPFADAPPAGSEPVGPRSST